MKIHGKWCGPNWTGGRKLSAEEYAKRGYSWDAPCTDALDCACRAHDKACSHPKGCSKKADTALIKAARRLELAPLERIRLVGVVANPFSSRSSRKSAEKKLDMDDKAGLIVNAITIARLTRRH